MFFFAENLTSQSLTVGNPWEFVLTEHITAQIRASKEDRQNWYGNPKTRHCFYTGIEPANPNIRPGKSNPPRKIHAFTADYDARIPAERVAEAIAAMKFRPAWVERSLGGNVRLLWTLPSPLLVDDYGFAAYVLEAAIKWLQLDLLPALDGPAFQSPSRLLCNGCEWTATGHGDLPAIATQAFFVAAGRSYRFAPANESDIPLDVVEKEIRARFPGFNWPGEFTVESQGPSFWLPESVSPLSAIVKPTGIFTFSAHATKPFYSWADILGAEFTRGFTETSVSKATDDIWWDGKHHHYKVRKHYVSAGREEMLNHFKVNCKLGSKPDKTGISPTEVALAHIYAHNRIKAAVPFVFRPSGVIDFQGERMLNTYIHHAIAPAEGAQTWGASGNFPFLSLLLDGLFDPASQLPHFLAWFQYYYRTAFEQAPAPGQNAFFMGGVGIGKTYLNRQIIGAAVGGFVDASDYLVDGAAFNSHLMHKPHWCLDDDTPSNNPAANARLSAVFKKMAANQQFLSNQKFEVSGMTEWMGRIGCTTNLDYVSSRIVGSMDNSSLDKTCLFRCAARSAIKFPSRSGLTKIVKGELPNFLRWVLDWKIPDFIEMDSRYGPASFQEQSLLTQSHQSHSVAPFKELLIETLDEWFRLKPEDSDWRGTVSQLIKMMLSNPANEAIMRSVRLEQTNRYLEQIQKEGLLKVETETGAMNTRIWIFMNPNPTPPATTVAPSMPQIVPIFSPKVV